MSVSPSSLPSNSTRSPVVVERGEDGLEYGEEQGVSHLALVARLVVVELEAPEPLGPLGPREVGAQLVLRRRSGEGA